MTHDDHNYVTKHSEARLSNLKWRGVLNSPCRDTLDQQQVRDPSQPQRYEAADTACAICTQLCTYQRQRCAHRSAFSAL